MQGKLLSEYGIFWQTDLAPIASTLGYITINLFVLSWPKVLYPFSNSVLNLERENCLCLAEKKQQFYHVVYS